MGVSARSSRDGSRTGRTRVEESITSPLGTPARGYSTLSRLDSSSWTPSTLTSTRRLFIDHLFGLLVGAQPQEPREPQPPLPGTFPEPDLDHLLRSDPDGGTRVVAGKLLHERRRVGTKRQQRLLQLALGGRRDPAADPPAVVQAAVRRRHPDQHRTDD